MNNLQTNRRDILKVTATAISTSLLLKPAFSAEVETKPTKPTLCLFSKPLQNRPVQELPAVLTDFGFVQSI